MNRLAQFALTAFLALFFSIQLYLTVNGGFLWPFSSHRLFSQLPKTQKTIVQAVLEDAKGNIFIVHPGRVIPIEYSRCSGLVRNLFNSGTPFQKKSLLSYLIKRLNENPWDAFDEMYSSIKSPSGAPFISLKFENHIIEFQEGEYPRSIQLKERRSLFP